MYYRNYKKVRSTAWKVLINHNIRELPVPLARIANESGITLLKNAEVNELKDGEVGISIMDGKQWYIVYNNDTNKGRIRFTIAHELGHIFLQHPTERSGYHTRKFKLDKPEVETEADSFASRLLCPSCVLWGLQVHTARDIAQLCGVSYTAAKIRAARMRELYARDKFLRSYLERKVYKNFEDYINNFKNNL